MSYTKRWLEDCSVELGFDGKINDEVLAYASKERCPWAWKRAMDRRPDRMDPQPAVPPKKETRP